jgi:hypothetical protein
MFQCRVPIAILLVLTLPLQSFASGSCCQRGQESCCSASVKQSNNHAKTCCSRTTTNTQSSGCKHCAAAEENAETNLSSVGSCNCHCKQNPKERPATEYRRQLNVESILISRDSLFVVAQSPVPAPLKIEVTDQSLGLRLNVIHCVWLI